MSENKLDKELKFVNLHGSHTTFSLYDGFGFPIEHMKYSYDIGLDAIGFTEHGNMNSLTYALEAQKKLKTEGKNIKLFYGIEFYYVDSLPEWREEYKKAFEKKKSLRALEDEMVPEDEESIKKEIKDIVNQRNHLLAIAINEKGLKNLFQLVTKSFSKDNFYRYPRIDFKLLKEHNEGLIISTACIGGIIGNDYWKNKNKGEAHILNSMGQTCKKFQNIFKNRFYGELQFNAIPEQHEINLFLINVCQKLGIELITTIDVHYPNPDMWESRELYKRLGWLGKANSQKPEWANDELPKKEDLTCDLFPKNAEGVWLSYKNFAQKMGYSDRYDDEVIKKSINNTYKIAHDIIEEFHPDVTVKLPSFIVNKNTNALVEIIKICKERLKELKLDNNKEYINRVKYELDVIKNRNFCEYFYTMYEIVKEAKKHMLVNVGRGSSGGSLVAFLLNITELDPIRWKLQFERFLRKDGTDYPDIDSDFSRNDELKQILKDKWGDFSVIPITNYNTLKLKSLIKDLSKFYNIPFQEVNAVTTMMLNEAIPKAKEKHGIVAGVYNPTFEEVKEYSESLRTFFRKYPFIKKHVENLHGMVRSFSRHAGGCIISDDLHKNMPLISTGGGGNYQTPWSEGQNVRHLEPLGFIKFDLLGVSTLKIIEECIERILKRRNKKYGFEMVRKFYDKFLHPNVANYADLKVWENIFHKGDKWISIFQFTGEGAQNFCVQAKPNSIQELSNVTSIFRPATLSSNVDKEYIEIKDGKRNIEYDHSILENVLGETLGHCIYQEQVAEIVHKLGKDISLDEGNLLRKILIKKGIGDNSKKIEKIYVKFEEGCLEKGLDVEKIKEIWHKLELFSGYGFVKSHSVAYSILSYNCAWLMTYFPMEWACSYLTNVSEKEKEHAILLVKQCGFKMCPFDINSSEIRWEVSSDGKCLNPPLSFIKGLGETAIEQIVKNKPYNKIEDLIFNGSIAYNKLNKKSFDALVKSQALNKLIDKRFSNMKHFWHVVCEDKLKKTEENKFLEHIEKYKDVEDFTYEEKIEFLVNLTGIFPFELILTEEVKKRIEFQKVKPLGLYKNKEKCEGWCIPREVKALKTKKNNKDYYLVEVLDSTNKKNIIKCWGVDLYEDNIYINRPYKVKFDYEEKYGFSTRGMIKKSWTLLG